MLVAEARQAIKEEAPLDRLRSLTAELQQIYHGLGAAAAGGAGGGAGAAGGAGGTPGAEGRDRNDDDDVIDADFTTS
jgi:molecular chaperone DnaK